MANRGIGLELSFTRLKLVVLESKKDGVTISHYDTEDVLKGETIEESIQNISLAVNTIMKRNKISGKLGVSFLSHTIFNRQVRMLPQPDEELYKTLSFEINEYLPFPANEAIWGYHKIDRQYNPGEEFDVVVVAAKYEVMEQMERILGSLIYKVDVLQFVPLALYSYLKHEYPDKKETYLVLDIGETNNDMIVVEEGKFWHRILNIAGKDITKTIVTKLGVSEEEAMEAKSSKLTPQLQQAIAPVVKNLATEINRSINFYKYTSKRAVVSEIKLCGSTSKLSNLPKMLQEATLIRTSCMDVPQSIYINPSIEQNIASQITSLYPAIGLALQAVNKSNLTMEFTPYYVIEYKQFSKKKPVAVAGLLFVVIAVVLAYFSLSKKTIEMENQVRKMKEVVLVHDNWYKKYQQSKVDLYRRYLLNFLPQLYRGKDKILYILDSLIYEIKRYNVSVSKEEKIYLVGFDYSIVRGPIIPPPSSIKRPKTGETKKEQGVAPNAPAKSPQSEEKKDNTIPSQEFIRLKDHKYKFIFVFSSQKDWGGYSESVSKDGRSVNGPFTTMQQKISVSDQSSFISKFMEVIRHNLMESQDKMCVQRFKEGTEPKKCPIPKYDCSDSESTRSDATYITYFCSNELSEQQLVELVDFLDKKK